MASGGHENNEIIPSKENDDESSIEIIPHAEQELPAENGLESQAVATINDKDENIAELSAVIASKLEEAVSISAATVEIENRNLDGTSIASSGYKSSSENICEPKTLQDSPEVFSYLFKI